MSNIWINTDRFSAVMRSRVVDLVNRKVLICSFIGSEQLNDLTVPPNCNGFGRIHHFNRNSNSSWPDNPLPIDPVVKALGISRTDQLLVQVFQIGACNWRCWYCFVDNKLLSANKKTGSFLSCNELLDLYCLDNNTPKIIDLTGGYPDLVPEWTIWMMQGLIDRDLQGTVYLWGDDNLSTDYFWRYLRDDDIELLLKYKNYGRVGCFKGFDEASFSQNTGASPEQYYLQFELMKRLASLQLDLYCYATFTTMVKANIKSGMAQFVDRLQEINVNLPLRTVPIEIKLYTPTAKRIKMIPDEILSNQYIAVDAWMDELSKRFTTEELNTNITDVSLK